MLKKNALSKNQTTFLLKKKTKTINKLYQNSKLSSFFEKS